MSQLECSVARRQAEDEAREGGRRKIRKTLCSSKSVALSGGQVHVSSSVEHKPPGEWEKVLFRRK